MRFQKSNGDESDPIVNVSLAQDGNNVKIVINGIDVAFFNSGTGRLVLISGLGAHVNRLGGLKLTARGEIVTV